jgi:hypothetical protein
MAGKSKYLKDKQLNWLKGTTYPAAPTATYVGLFTANPTDDTAATATEVSGNNYARVAIADTVWGSITDTGGAASTVFNSSAITFPTPSGSWGTIVGIGLFDASTAGNLLYWNSITSQSIASGVVASFAANALEVTDL